VDSFNTDGKPAAIQYLESICVPACAVDHLVITHFHTDHYRGVEKLHDYFTQAFLHVTEAVEEEEFRKLQVDDEDPGFLGGLPGVIARAKSRRINGTPGFGLPLGVGRFVVDEPGVRIRALSPTRDAVIASIGEIARALSELEREPVAAYLRDENRSSVALHIDAESSFRCSALLGADLVAKPKRFGWDAVLAEPLHRYLSAAHLMKVPHHGSENAHHQPAWDRFVVGGALLLVAPYWSSGLPLESDVARLKGLGELWQAAPEAKWKIVDGHRVSAEIEIGIVQARRRAGDNAWRVCHQEPAFKL
jgi:hypothetical protein